MEDANALKETYNEWILELQHKGKGNHFWYEIRKEVENGEKNPQQPVLHTGWNGLGRDFS